MTNAGKKKPKKEKDPTLPGTGGGGGFPGVVSGLVGGGMNGVISMNGDEDRCPWFNYVGRGSRFLYSDLHLAQRL